MAVIAISPTLTDAHSLLGLRADELDQLYSSASPGPVPTGAASGTALFRPGRRGSALFAHVTRMLAWQGKRFTASGQELDNSITPLRKHAVRAQVYVAPSWLDGRDTIVIDYSRTSRLARLVRDEIREIAPGLYLGIVYVGKRRIPLRFALAV